MRPINQFRNKIAAASVARVFLRSLKGMSNLGEKGIRFLPGLPVRQLAARFVGDRKFS
jgi:hypothetical protein